MTCAMIHGRTIHCCIELSADKFVRLSGFKSNVVRPEFLFSYTPIPGTVFFAGYGGTVEDEDAYRFRRLTRQQDQLFVKLSYLLRRCEDNSSSPKANNNNGTQT